MAVTREIAQRQMKGAIMTIKHNEAMSVPTEILADSIVTVAQGMRRLLNGALGENALILLVQDAAGGRNAISQEDVKKVLRSAARLDELYIRKPKAKR